MTLFLKGSPFSIQVKMLGTEVSIQMVRHKWKREIRIRGERGRIVPLCKECIQPDAI